MDIIQNIRKFWEFLKQDTWQSWVISLLLMVVVIKLIIFPTISLITGTSQSLLVIESCSMYHAESFENWWASNGAWYETHNISKSEFENYKFKNGLNKGDIVLLWNVKTPSKGDVIIFMPNSDSLAQHPIIHRVIEIPTQTKGDNNPVQLTKTNNLLKVDETNIPDEKVIGKTALRIPVLGWIKLIFFEPFKPASERGLCKQN